MGAEGGSSPDYREERNDNAEWNEEGNYEGGGDIDQNQDMADQDPNDQWREESKQSY